MTGKVRKCRDTAAPSAEKHNWECRRPPAHSRGKGNGAPRHPVQTLLMRKCMPIGVASFVIFCLFVVIFCHFLLLFCHALSCIIMFCHFLPLCCHVLPFCVILCHLFVIFCHVLSFLCHFLSFFVFLLSFVVMFCHLLLLVVDVCHLLSLFCHLLSFVVIFCHFVSFLYHFFPICVIFLVILCHFVCKTWHTMHKTMGKIAQMTGKMRKCRGTAARAKESTIGGPGDHRGKGNGVPRHPVQTLLVRKCMPIGGGAKRILN